MSNQADSPRSVRLAAARFIDNRDGTVTDTRLELMWSQATLNPREVGYATAQQLCAELRLGGHADWRLPTVEQLFALADRACSEPAIDAVAFPGTRQDWYWSCTGTAFAPPKIWIVSFGNGLASYTATDDYLGGYVRAVRPLRAGA